jgi:alpha-L-rhamnosidase
LVNTLEPHAHWIWCRGEERPKNFYLYCRRVIALEGAIRHARIRLTADSRYRLWVNGVAVGRGPARCDPRWQCLDSWEITSELRRGTNVIAALIHHYGEWTFSYILGRGGLLAELTVELEDGRVLRVETDDSWRVRPAEAWERNLPRMSIQLGYPEVYDARKEIAGWKEPEFDDSGWEPATVLGRAGMNPWPNFIPREIPAMSETPRAAVKVIESGELGGVTLGHYVDLLRVVWNTANAVAYLATFVWSPREMETEIHAGSQDAIRLWVNRGEVLAHLVTRDPAPDQEIVRTHLNAGWNVVLAKIVQGEGQWHFYFRFVGEGSEELVLSSSRTVDPAQADPVRPWKIAAPFPCGTLPEGFGREFGPEQDPDFRGTYRRADGEEIAWSSAGVTQESMLTSVLMGREAKLSGPGGGIEDTDGLVGPGAPALFHPGTEHGRYAVIDFGLEVTGYPLVEIQGALGGEIIDMGYAEALESPTGELLPPASCAPGNVNPDRAAVHNADRYICRPGRQHFQTFDKRAFRYLQLDVRNLRQPIRVGPVSLVFSSYPVEYQGSFECSDTLLNRIWEIGRWTAQLNMEDAYSDSPWRERAQWWGDVRVEAFVSYYAFGDTRLLRQGLRQIAQSQTADGLTMGIYPTQWPGGILPTYTLLWVLSLRDYVLYSGDLELLGELFPAVERAMAFFAPLLSEHGLLRDVPHWLFVDWAPVMTGGESTAVNALYCGALSASAEMAAELGQLQQQHAYARAADGLRGGMHQYLWDPGAMCFRDSWREGFLSPTISEQANCWAIVFGAAPEGSVSQILPSLLEDGRADIRIATPYFAFYLLQALALANRHERALEYIRAKWGAMVEWGATTWWETWEPKASLCHGWSAGPTSFLQSEILGVKPARPGWEEILLEPHPAELAWARGVVPTPLGKIHIEWRIRGNMFSLLFDIPSRASVMLPEPWSRNVTVRRTDGIRAAYTPPESWTPGRILIEEPGSYAIECHR